MPFSTYLNRERKESLVPGVSQEVTEIMYGSTFPMQGVQRMCCMQDSVLFTRVLQVTQVVKVPLDPEE